MPISYENLISSVIGLAAGTTALMLALVKFVIPRIEKGYDKAISAYAEENNRMLTQMQHMNVSIQQMNTAQIIHLRSLDETAIAIKEQSQSIREYAKSLSELAMGINRHQEKVDGDHKTLDNKHVDILQELRK